jgi:hypothetical protein
MVGGLPPTAKPAPVDLGTSSEGTWSAEKGSRREWKDIFLQDEKVSGKGLKQQQTKT